MSGEEKSREMNVFLAKIAEQAERYEEMAELMWKVAKQGPDLSVEERNLLSVAYKNVIGAKRAAWRIVSSLEARAEKEDKDKAIIYKYKVQIEKELNDICEQIILLLDETLIPNSKEEPRVFFLKIKLALAGGVPLRKTWNTTSQRQHSLKTLQHSLRRRETTENTRMGDYYRYQAEISGEKESDAKEAYEKAEEIAQTLPCTNPIRLGLALNFSVFHYEILKNSNKACELAKKAFDSAIGDLDTLNEDSYKDSTLIMQLLRDNLTLWTSEDGKDDTKLEDMEESSGK